MRLIFFSLFVISGIVIILYLSWLPQPRLGLVWFMPDWLANWTDANENDTLRTGVPFVVLGIVIGSWLLKSGYSWYWWLASWGFLLVIVLTAEIGQLILPNRHFDWWDIVWGSTGAVVGMGSAILGNHLKSFITDR